jgi:hypothetical protein
MKKIILGLCILTTGILMCVSARAMDEVRVPVKVKAEFRHEYKHVNGVAWAMNDGRYEVSFRKDGKPEPMVARYNGVGHRIDTRVAVAQSEMPVKAVGHLEEKYRDSYTHKYTRIERRWKRDLYMVKVKDKGNFVPVYVDKDGHEHDYSSR